MFVLQIFYQQLLHEQFGSKHVCVFLIVAFLQAAANLLRNISAVVHLDLFVNEFQLRYS